MQNEDSAPLARLRAVFRMGNRLLAAVGGMPEPPKRDEQIQCGQAVASKPYIGTALGDARAGEDVFLALHFPEGTLPPHLKQIDIVGKDRRTPWESPVNWNLSRPMLKEWQSFVSALKSPQRKRIWYVLSQCMASYPKLNQDALFLAHAHTARALLEDSVQLINHYWILPRLLYAEMYLPQGTPATAQVVCNNERAFIGGDATLLKVPDAKAPQGMEHFVVIVMFSTPLAKQANGLKLTLAAGTNIYAPREPLKSGAPIEGQTLVLLQQRDALTRQRLRELLGLRLLALVRAHDAKATELATLLQHYLHFPHTSVTQPDQPFGINIEQAVPLPGGDVFIAGWIRNPKHLIERIRLISDLGPSFEMQSHMTFYRRPDVEALYKGTPNASASEARGFVAICRPDEMLPEGVSWHAFRVEIRLKGGLEYVVTPPAVPKTFIDRRNMLLREVAPLCIREPRARDVVYRALFSLQRTCATQAKTGHIHRFGKPVSAPETSLVIPLYKNLDYLKTQYALLASDPGIRASEVIYVLDAPELEETVRVRLKDLFSIYQLPITLAVMEENAGYAGATNAGARLAKGKYLILLNADVVPQSPGWVRAMRIAYEKNKSTGALGVKLLLEDESVQHGGMHFTLAPDGGYVLNHHDGKGCPADFEGVSTSRVVPAVTGACLMVRRDLFEKVGRLSTDYIIGDFEDSDLCLKLSELGFTSYYLADVALYHFERSSMPEHDAYLPAINFDYNARLHYARWKPQLHALMKHHGAA